MSSFKRSFEIAKKLADGQFHSGQQLAHDFNMTRAAVHYLIMQLRAGGVKVEAVRGLGYRIAGGIDWLQPAQVMAQLPEVSLDYRPWVESTQDVLLQRAREPYQKVQLCVTEYQTKGRGRVGAPWQMTFANSLCFSLLRRFECGLQNLGGLNLAIATAIVEAMEQLGAQGLQLKWPNDLYTTHGQKWGGILSEAIGDLQGPTLVVMGVGINLITPTAVPDRQVAGLADTGAAWASRSALLVTLVQALLAACEQYESIGLSDFLPRFAARDYLAAHRIRFHTMQGIQEAAYQGVGAYGELCIDAPPYRVFSAEKIERL